MSQQALVTIVVKGWTGWTLEQPEAQWRQLLVKAGTRITPTAIGIPSDEYVILVDSVRSDRIMVSYSGVVAKNDDGTINLTAPRQGRCIIPVGNRLNLSTATMDAGTSVSVTLDSIVVPSTPVT